MTKVELRRSVTARRGELDAAWVTRAGAAIRDRALELPALKAARIVGLYVALPGEVPTDDLARRLRRGGAEICVPAFRADAGVYGLARWPADGALARGPWGVPEPVAPEWVAVHDVDVAVVPGLAFDVDGGRVGHGGGHYDRLLAGAGRAPLKVGVCFDFQVFARVPMTATDVWMDRVITEVRAIDTAARGAALGR